MDSGMLIHGENIEAMRWLLENGYRETVDLVYVDPPFATNGVFGVSDGRASTISRARGAETVYTDRITGAAFVAFIRDRLILARDLLSPHGSLYLHTDCKIGPYLRVMMDEVFGIANFRGEITRVKCNPKNFPRVGYGNIKDSILFYTKGDKPIWHEPHESYSASDVMRLFPKTDAQGRRFTTVPIHAPGENTDPKPFKGTLPPKGRHWRTDVTILEQWDSEGRIEWSDTGNPRKIIYADEREGKRVQDIWANFKDPMYPAYPTEKNVEMLDLIVRTSSNPESIVLDFFCGSGTTAVAAMRNGRKWIAIDQSDAAIAVAKKKLGFAEGHGADSGRCEFIDFSVHSSNPKTTPPMRYPEQNDKGQMLLAMEQEAKYHARPRRKLAKKPAI